MASSTLKLKDKPLFNISGFIGLLVIIGLFLFGFKIIKSSGGEPLAALVGLAIMILGFILTSGFMVISPQESRVIQFFGQYLGTIEESGLRWTLPLTTKVRVSLKLRNFESPKLKVNEAEGNPIEIAAIVVWKVQDSAQALFNVDDLERFVEKQTESALRTLATKYPYDKHPSHKLSLHEHINEVNAELRTLVSQSLQDVGIHIQEARISLLAYAPEIAAAMLQRQQAQAIVAARQKIVDGAVGMVHMALQQLQKDGIVHLDEAKKAAMVSNLLVVLCSERPTQPVLNTGQLS